MIDSWLFLYISLIPLSFFASRKERTFFPLFLGSVCGLARMILGYTVPAAGWFFNVTGLNARAVIAIVTIALEAFMFRDKKRLSFYLMYYASVSLTALVAEIYGMLSGFWSNTETGFLGLDWRSILFYYFCTFFVVLKLGELIYFFSFKKLFNEFYITDS